MDWRWSIGPYLALSSLSLEEFQERISQSSDDSDKVIEILLYEAKKAIRLRENSLKEKRDLQTEVLNVRARNFKDQPDPEYGDIFNRLVCKKLDSLENDDIPFPEGLSKLAFAQKIILEEMRSQITDRDLLDYLVNKNIFQFERRLNNLFQEGQRKFGWREEAFTYALFLFEIDLRKTDDIWGGKQFCEVVERAFKGETVNLITMLCCINRFDYKGGYECIPDLKAYLENPKLEAIPLIVDELTSLIDLFRFYGINTELTIFVADTDYTEIKQYGEVTEENLNNMSLYIKNLRDYISSRQNITVLPISELTNGNLLYFEIKTRVLENLKNFRDQDFTREWYAKFENAYEKISESQTKKGLTSRKESLEIAKRLWAVNSAQGAVFATLGKNTVLVSTERRERDQNYVIDKDTRGNFPSVLYVLSAAEKWNRKLIGKSE